MAFFCPPSMAKDVYKEFHRHAYKKGISKVFANFINRNGKYSNTGTSRTANFGLQFHIKDYLMSDWQNGFFNLKKEVAVRRHRRILSAMLGYEVDVSNLEALHDLGYLPIEIRALPEGVMVPYGVPTFTIENTHPDFAWLTNSLETAISADVWPMQTNATTAVKYFAQFKLFDYLTGGNGEGCKFQGHDFSARGLFMRQSAVVGMAHLASGLVGTDTIAAVVAAEDFYNANVDTELVGCSVNATEHSVTCSHQDDEDPEAEEKFYLWLMNEVSKEGILSLVFDTWDFWKGVTVTLPRIKDQIMKRKGKVVVRPDSGDPVKILCGIPFIEVTDETLNSDWELIEFKQGDVLKCDGKYYTIDWKNDENFGTEENPQFGLEIPDTVETEISEAEIKGLIECLWDIFGGTTQKGVAGHEFKVLDEHIGAIYGDSITLERQEEILTRLMDKGFASCNVVLGIGSYTYQYVTRDTHGSAIKATSVVLDGKRKAIFKDPKTDPGKKSAKGLTKVIIKDGDFVRLDDVTEEEFNAPDNCLKTVFKDGKLVKQWSLEQVRERFSREIELGRV